MKQPEMESRYLFVEGNENATYDLSQNGFLLTKTFKRQSVASEGTHQELAFLLLPVASSLPRKQYTTSTPLEKKQILRTDVDVAL